MFPLSRCPLQPGWAETLSNALIGLGIEIGMRLFLVDSARALLMSSMVLTDVAIIAMLILQFDVPVALAIVSVVVINVLLAGNDAGMSGLGAYCRSLARSLSVSMSHSRGGIH